MIRRVTGLSGTAVGAASVSALCCAGPLISLVVGVSGGALAGALAPFRPLFLGITVVALGGGYLLAWREERKACDTGAACASPEVRRRTKILLGVSTLLAIVLASYPTWKKWL